MHAQALIWDGRFDEARRQADEAIELADQLELPRLAADVSVTLTWLNQHLDLGEGSRAELKRIIAEAQARGDVLSELRGFMRCGGLEYDYGELAAAQENYLEAARLARQIGRPWTIQGIAGRMLGAVMAYMRGEWDEALAIVDHSDEDPPPTARAMLEAVGLAVAAGRGDVSALDRFPALRERWHREGLIAVVGGGAAIELQSLRDGAAVAVATYDDIYRVLGPLWGETFGARLRLAVLALAALADEAPRTSTGARDEVRATAARLVGDAEQVLAVRSEDERPFQLEGRAWEARLRAEERRLEWLLGARVDLADLVGRWRTTVDAVRRPRPPRWRRPAPAPGSPRCCARPVTAKPASTRPASRVRWPGACAPPPCSRSWARSAGRVPRPGRSPRASARSSPWSPPVAATQRSVSSCSSRPRRSACTSPT